jgi:5-methylcytosine-specific restriction endonuclease McrA
VSSYTDKAINPPPRLEWLREMGYSSKRPKGGRVTFRQKNHLCCYCGKKLQKGQATKEHPHPKHAGGKNVVPCCRRCNQFKGGDTLAEFAERLRVILVSIEKMQGKHAVNP